MCGIDEDEVEPGLARPERHRPVPPSEVADVPLGHQAGLLRVEGGSRHRHP